MELKNVLTPWNWFKKEEEEEEQTLQPRNRRGNTQLDHPLLRWQRDMDELFEKFYRNVPLSPFHGNHDRSMGGLLLPSLDIAENKKGYTITVEVPGIEEKDMELTVADGTLTIRGEKRSEKEHSDNQYHRVERSYGAFRRVLSLPTDADQDNVEAKFKNGVLTITVDKTPKATSAGRKVSVT